MLDKVKGNTSEFDKNWKTRKEANYYHYKPLNEKVENQIQFAFRQHFLLFQEQIKQKIKKNNMKFCELGCGRGTLSAYFAEKGYNCTLIDSSKSIIEGAKELFSKYNYKGKFLINDVLSLPKNIEKQFSVVASIGLVEHFTDICSVLDSHNKLLKVGGRGFCYIVPRDHGDIQKYFYFINFILKTLHKIKTSNLKKTKKTQVFRNGYFSKEYKKALERLKINDYSICGLYPYPMISYSIDFPFSLTNQFLEKIIVSVFNLVKYLRGNTPNHWECESEKLGNAILISWTKN